MMAFGKKDGVGLLFVDGDTPLIVDGEIVRVVGTTKQCKVYFADGRRCSRPRTVGGLCEAHKRESDMGAVFDLGRPASGSPVRKHFEYEGDEDALVRELILPETEANRGKETETQNE
jgi:hypothetical protein